MGRRIHFYKNDSGKELKLLIIKHFDKFNKWHCEKDKAWVEKYDEPYSHEKVLAFFEKNKSFPENITHVDQRIIDEITSDFVTEYTATDAPLENLFDFFGPTMATWRYDESTKMVLKSDNQELIKLWNYVIKGRSLKDDSNFNGFSNEYKIGFLNHDEQRTLKKHIEAHFGNIEELKQKYYTFWERRKEKIVQKKAAKGIYVPLGFEPVCAGLEYVLQALNEILETKHELIIGIE